MTNGWDKARRVPLADPWEEFWVEAYLDPEIGLYLDLRARLNEAVGQPVEEALDALVATLPPLIKDHNIVGRDGNPIVWTARAMGSLLIRRVCDAVMSVQGEGGGSDDPLPSKPKRATSRRR